MATIRSKAKFAVLAGLCGALTLGGVSAYASDIEGHWNEAGLQEWIDYGILQGYGNTGTYAPDATTTRAELVTFLDRIMQYKQSSENKFPDLDRNWYTDVVLRGVAAGIISGDGQGTMRPNDPVTREEAAVIFARVLDLDNGEAPAAEFTDGDQVSDWARSGVNAMKDACYINGYPDGSFRPKDPIRRGEIIAMLDNMFSNLYQKAGSFSDKTASSAVVSAAGVTLKDQVVQGDLVIAEGVSSGGVVLDNVLVRGKLIVRGGGAESISIKGASHIDEIVVDRQKDAVQLDIDRSSSVGSIAVVDDTASVSIKGDAPSVLVSADDAKVSLSGAHGLVKVTGDDVTLVAEKAAKLDRVKAEGKGGAVSGAGKVTAIDVLGDGGLVVETTGSRVNNNSAAAVKVGDKTLSPGSVTGAASEMTFQNMGEDADEADGISLTEQRTFEVIVPIGGIELGDLAKDVEAGKVEGT